MADDHKPVVILGAGFSKAVHDDFPVLSELAKCVLPRIEDHAAPSTRPMVRELRRVVEPSPGSEDGPPVDFEGWLSRLATDQPHLSAAENLERRALFARAATAIRSVLLEAHNKAFRPDRSGALWPLDLVRLLGLHHATVITMNYDLIIETLGPEVLRPWQHPLTHGEDWCESLYAADLFQGLPPTDPPPPQEFPVSNPLNGGSPRPRRVPETLRLLKLHGSVDWFASPTDPAGVTLIRRDLYGGAQNDDHPFGREPFLVPPDANKSPYFSNPLVREIWLRARSALEQADSVTLVGYSLPATDTTFGGLLADGLAGRSVPKVVVDKRPDSVVTRLRTLGLEPEVPEYHGESAIEEWTTNWVQRTAEAVADKLRERREIGGPRDGDSIWNAVACSNRQASQDQYVHEAEAAPDNTIVLRMGPREKKIPEGRPLWQLLPLETARRIAVDLDGHRHLVVAYALAEPKKADTDAILTLLLSFSPFDDHP